MSLPCRGNDEPEPDIRPRDARYRRVLWVALGVNGVMSLVEIAAGSAALQADALDFFAWSPK